MGCRGPYEAGQWAYPVSGRAGLRVAGIGRMMRRMRDDIKENAGPIVLGVTFLAGLAWLLFGCVGAENPGFGAEPAESVSTSEADATWAASPELATSDGGDPDVEPDADMANDVATDAPTIVGDASDSGAGDALVDSSADTTPAEASACVPVSPPRGCITSPPCANAVNPGLGGGILVGQLCSNQPAAPSNCSAIPVTESSACGGSPLWVLCCWTQ